MIESSEENIFNKQHSHDYGSVQNQELRLSLIRELNAALTFHKVGEEAQLELKHTYPIGVGMYES